MLSNKFLYIYDLNYLELYILFCFFNANVINCLVYIKGFFK